MRLCTLTERAKYTDAVPTVPGRVAATSTLCDVNHDDAAVGRFRWPRVGYFDAVNRPRYVDVLGEAISPGIRPSFDHTVGFIWAIFPYAPIHLSDTTLLVSRGFAAYDVNEGLTKAVMKSNCKVYSAIGVREKDDSAVINVSQCEGAICQFHFREDMVLNETVVK